MTTMAENTNVSSNSEMDESAKKKSEFDTMLNQFKDDCIKSGVFDELRKREYYQGPSARRRSKSERARKRNRNY